MATKKKHFHQYGAGEFTGVIKEGRVQIRKYCEGDMCLATYTKLIEVSKLKGVKNEKK